MRSGFEDVRQRGFLSRHKVDEVMRKLEEFKINLLEVEEIDFRESLNRVCAEDVTSKRNVPPFNRSAVDGYALRAEETFGASMNNPVIFRVVGEIEIGERGSMEIKEGEAVRISTGAPMPKNADAVAMIEHTSKIEGDFIEVYSSLPPWKNVSRAGEDLREGEVVIKKGEIIQPHHIALLTASANLRIKVFRKPIVGVISTGNELVDAVDAVEAGNLQEGKIVDTNRYMLMNLVRQYNAEPIDFGIVRDDPESLRNTLISALKKTDIFIFSGATSVGTKDLLPEIINEFRDAEDAPFIHGLAIKPGMPAGITSIRGKPVLLLPGFPVASYIAFNLLFPKIVFKMYGMDFEEFYPPGSILKVVAGMRIPSTAGVRTFTRAILEKKGDRLFAYPLRTSGSGILSSLSKAHGIIEVMEDKEGVEEGEEVEIRLINYFFG
ncbi:molybdopterin molybdenumtransferase MoeA [Archaeoglobales archaeon]|nr:MAG: molybdopterin molybdenumtransferase MoeA [Archaeoglobales archaeon]